MRPTLVVLGRYGFQSSLNPLEDSGVSTAAGTNLSYYGYSFEVPWRGIDTVQKRMHWVEIHFKSGLVLTFFNPKYFQADLIDDGGTKYEQYKAVLSMTTSQLSPFCSHEHFARSLKLLEVKGTMFEHSSAAPDIYSFRTNRYRGFEISGLSQNWQSVGLILFDAADREINIGVDAGRPGQHPAVKITQTEINRVIQSFRAEP